MYKSEVQEAYATYQSAYNILIILRDVQSTFEREMLTALTFILRRDDLTLEQKATRSQETIKEYGRKIEGIRISLDEQQKTVDVAEAAYHQVSNLF